MILSVLVSKIRELQNSDLPNSNEFLNKDTYEIAKEISCLLDTQVCTDLGPNYDIIEYLEEVCNCNIGPGEEDSFGWVTGVLTTSKGKILF